MHPSIPRLIELQEVDLRLAEVQARLDALPRRVMDANKRVENARQQHAAAKTSLTNSLKDRKTFEMDVQSWKEKVKKYKDQTAQVKSNEAYKALLHEVEMAETEIAKAEDRLLDRMMAGEQFEVQVKDAERNLKEVEKGTEVELAQIKAENEAALKQKATDEEATRQAASRRSHVPTEQEPRRDERDRGDRERCADLPQVVRRAAQHQVLEQLDPMRDR